MGPKIYDERTLRSIKGWKRISEIEGAVLIKDTANFNDII